MLHLYSKNTVTGNLVHFLPWAQLSVTFNFYWKKKKNGLVLTVSPGRTNTQLVNICIFKIIPAVHETQFILIHQRES